MGAFDLPSPLLSWIDAAVLGALPPWARIAAWGVIGALLSMGLYGLVSPQHRLAGIVVEEQRLKAMLRREDTGMAEGLRMGRRLLTLALARIGLVMGPAMAGAVPVVCLIVWLQTAYGHDLPSVDQTPAVRVQPGAVQGRWVVDASGAPRVELVDAHGEVLQTVLLHLPVPVVHKRAWWNTLIGNPLGYLAADSPAERIDIDLPAKRYLMIGPGWLGGWESPFLLTLVTISLVLKRAARLT